MELSQFINTALPNFLPDKMKPWEFYEDKDLIYGSKPTKFNNVDTKSLVNQIAMKIVNLDTLKLVNLQVDREFVVSNDQKPPITNPFSSTGAKSSFKLFGKNYAYGDYAHNFRDYIVERTESSGSPFFDIKYSNGDKFSGYKDYYNNFSGYGEYFFKSGYTYKGNFLLNRRFGEGEYSDALGKKRKGWWFGGFRLNKDFGLKELKEEIEAFSRDQDKKMALGVDMSNFEYFFDPEIMNISGMFNNVYRHLEYEKIFKGIEMSKLEMANDLNMIKDGELDYEMAWGELMSASIKKHKETKITKSLFKALENNSESNIALSKRESRYDWINKLKTKKLNAWEIERIFELVRDEDRYGFRLVFLKFQNAENVLKLLTIRDKKKRNLLMVCAYFGYRQFFLDFLTALSYFLNKSENTYSEKARKSLNELIKQKDVEGNRIVDLLSIRGYIIKDDYSFCNCMIRKDEDGNDELIPNQFQAIDNYLSDNSRTLFTHNFVDLEMVMNNYNEIKAHKTSEKIFFLSRRAVILYGYLKFCKMNKMTEIMNSKDYIYKKNNPLHFALYHGDLHATILLLKIDPNMMFWKNGEKQFPPEIINLCPNPGKSKAIFGSILEEITRQFNFYLIKTLFVTKEGVLEIQKKKLDELNISKAPDENNTNYSGPQRDIDILLKKIDKVNVDVENIYLYRNNYILLSEELSVRYAEYLRDQSTFRLLRKEQKYIKRHVFIEVSELEALQRNFFDYYAGGFQGYHDKKTEEMVKERVQTILAWNVFIFGNADINPKIYSFIGIDPFERVIGGRNIFHYMCIYNSYYLMREIMDVLYEECHNEQLDLTQETYETWDKRTLDPSKYRRFRKQLTYYSENNHNSCGHFCVMNQSFECLDLLMNHNINLDQVNFRGRSIREFLIDFDPYNFESFKADKVRDISNNIISYLKADIFASCRQHSLSYEFVDGEFKELYTIMNTSVFALDKRLTSKREDVKKRMNLYDSHFKDNLRNIAEINDTVQFKEATNLLLLGRNQVNDKDKLSMLKKAKNEEDSIPQEYKLLSTNDQIYYLFNPDYLTRIPNFKYKKIEKYLKKRFLDKLHEADFNKILDPELKAEYSMEQLLCIEIHIESLDQSKEDKGMNIVNMDQLGKPGLIHDHIVLQQIFNIKEKYSEYGGGIKIELVRGFDLMKRSPAKLFLCPKKYESWFILVSLSDDLTDYIATEDKMETFNFIENYHTIFSEDTLEDDQLEPLRHIQKIKILMKLINEEFDIETYRLKGMLMKYFPIHNYNQRRTIKFLWSKYKWMLHFVDIFAATSKRVLMVVSVISFYHGIQQGFYFGFLTKYTNSMFYIALLGLISLPLRYFVKLDREVMVVFIPFFIGIWSTAAYTAWKRREVELAYTFDAFEEENVREIRDGYVGETIVDNATLKISKKVVTRPITRILLTTFLFLGGISFTVLIYILVRYLNKYVSVEGRYTQTIRNRYLLAIGVLNGTLNFIVATIYELFIGIFVSWENHAYLIILIF